MKGYTQIKKEDILLAIGNFDKMLEESKEAFRKWATTGEHVVPRECFLYYTNYVDTAEYKRQALIAEQYVNCDTELSDFVYKYLNWEDK